MKIKTSELIDLALDWAVGLALGYELSLYGVDPSIRARVPGLGVHAPWRPSRYWQQGGPIIESEEIQLRARKPSSEHLSVAWMERVDFLVVPSPHYVSIGPTPLIAAMRCYVASKLGDEVEVPDEFCA